MVQQTFWYRKYWGMMPSEWIFALAIFTLAGALLWHILTRPPRAAEGLPVRIVNDCLCQPCVCRDGRAD